MCFSKARHLRASTRLVDVEICATPDTHPESPRVRPRTWRASLNRNIATNLSALLQHGAMTSTSFELIGSRPKRQKISLACSVCRQLKTKCDGARPGGYIRIPFLLPPATLTHTHSGSLRALLETAEWRPAVRLPCSKSSVNGHTGWEPSCNPDSRPVGIASYGRGAQFTAAL